MNIHRTSTWLPTTSATHRITPKKAHPTHARTAKPAPLSKRSGSHGRKGNSHAVQHREVDDEDEDPMAVSFLNYWYVEPD